MTTEEHCQTLPVLLPGSCKPGHVWSEDTTSVAHFLLVAFTSSFASSRRRKEQIEKNISLKKLTPVQLPGGGGSGQSSRSEPFLSAFPLTCVCLCVCASAVDQPTRVHTLTCSDLPSTPTMESYFTCERRGMRAEGGESGGRCQPGKSTTAFCGI